MTNITTILKRLKLNLPPTALTESLEIANGLLWIPSLLTTIQQQRLLEKINSNREQHPLWLPDYHSIQMYGWGEKPTQDLSYLNRQRDYIGELPSWTRTIQNRLYQWMKQCDQIIVYQSHAICPLTCSPNRVLNTLPPGLHLTHTKNYGEAIAIIALSSLKIQFRRGMRQPIVVEIDSGDALIMRSEIRYQWLHQILFDNYITQRFIIVRTVNISPKLIV